VDTSEAPGYYERIRTPMDLGKIILRFKEGHYTGLAQIKADLELIITNCRDYNVDHMLPIRKKADKFSREIESELEKVYEGCREKGLDADSEGITISTRVLENYQILEEKKAKKRINIDISEAMPKRVAK
jgi:hypothetical protein